MCSRNDEIWGDTMRIAPGAFEKLDLEAHSLLEGVPNAVCEAMASGLPVLVGRIGDHERFVSDYENGFLFDPTSVQSILSALEKFCTSSAKQCFLMGSRSRLLAKKEFCPDRFVDAYETLFQRLIVKSFGGCTGPGSST